MKAYLRTNAIRCVVSVFVFIFCVSAVFGGNAKINWNVKKLTAAVGNGTIPLNGEVITFTSSKDIENADLWVVPGLRPYVKVTPVHFDLIEANQPYQVQFEFSLPYNAVNGQTAEGTIHLCTGSKTIAKPLPVEVTADFGDIVIADNVRVLSPESVEALYYVSQDYIDYAFSYSTPQLQALQVGDIIVIGPSELTPDGTAAKILDISFAGNEIHLHTSVAAIEEIIKEGIIAFSKHLEPDYSDSVSTSEERAKAASIEPQGFYVQLDNFVIVDLDGNHQTTYDQIVLNGFFAIDPHIDVQMHIHDWNVEYLRFVPSLVVAQEMEAIAKVDILSFNKKLSFPATLLATLLGKGIPAITIWAGWVPLRFTIGISPFVSGEGSVYVGLKSKVAVETTGQLGLEYESGEFSPVVGVNTQYEFEPIAPTAGAELKAAIGVEVSLRLWWVVGPYVIADQYLLLEADIFDDPWWKLWSGRELYGGFNASIPLYKTLFDWQFPFTYGERKLLASAPPGSGQLLETLTIPSDGSWVFSENDYSALKQYRLEVSGTYIWGGCDPYNCPGGGPCGYMRPGDAEWLTDDCWDSVYGDFYGYDISVYVDGGNVFWGPYNEEHVYSITRNGNGGPFRFHIYDCGPCYGDNSGSLTVKIYSTD